MNTKRKVVCFISSNIIYGCFQRFQIISVILCISLALPPAAGWDYRFLQVTAVAIPHLRGPWFFDEPFRFTNGGSVQ
jgi:hypothetical protein